MFDRSQNIVMKLQMLFFCAVLIAGGAIFAGKAWRLLPLYTSASTRDSVKSGLIAVTAREGWLLSDTFVTDVAQQNIRLIHHEHRRGHDSESCYMLSLSDRSLSPCD